MKNKKNIILYSSDTCHNCHDLKDYLIENNIVFEERNISQNKEYRLELIKRRIMGIPVLNISEEYIIGFDKEVINNKLGINN